MPFHFLTMEWIECCAPGSVLGTMDDDVLLVEGEATKPMSLPIPHHVFVGLFGSPFAAS